MAVFEKAFQRHERRKAVAAPWASENITRIGQDEFISSFRTLTREVVKPLFEELAHVAKSSGYAATAKEGVDEKDCPYYAITFVPEKGVSLGATPANECIFQVKAILQEQSVEYTSCHDQRPGKHGIRVTKSDLQSITKVFLEAEIEEFLTSSLAAREPV